MAMNAPLKGAQMNQLEALRETLHLAEQNAMPELPGSDLGLEHLRAMVATVEASDFSDAAKLGRWLGWAQCAVVAAKIGLTLDDMRTLNTKWAETAGAEPPQTYDGGVRWGIVQRLDSTPFVAAVGDEKTTRAIHRSHHEFARNTAFPDNPERWPLIARGHLTWHVVQQVEPTA